MKAVLVVLDGLADNHIPELDHQSTFARARHRNMDRLAAKGVQGCFNTCPAGYTPESMVCILSLLGISADFYPLSRASLEVLSHGYALQADEVVLRCNLIAVDSNNRLVSFNGGSLTKEEMRIAAETAAERIAGEKRGVKFLPMAEYRNLLVLKKENFTRLQAATFPPHEYLGHNVRELLNDVFSASALIQDFVYASAETLGRFQQADQRYLFYPWGLSLSHQLPVFAEMYRRSAAAVCSADIARGIALGLGMDVPDLPGATADTDTNLTGKAATACSLLGEYEFVFVHINGADEASHRCDCRGKIRFIERIDEEFVAYLLNNLKEEIKIMICADHATDPVTGKHAQLPVPFMIASTGQSRVQCYRKILKPIDALRFLLAE